MAENASSWLLAHARVGNKPHKQIKAEDVYSLFQQMSTLLQAGMPLADTLDLAASQTQSIRLGQVVEQIGDKVKAGSPLNAALAEHTKLFEPHWIQVIKTGEMCGDLGPLMRQLAEHMKESREARSQVISAMIYPAIIACVAVGAVVIMLWFVVPTFAQFFTETGSALPGITQFIINLSEFLQRNGLYMVGGLIVGGFAFRYWIRTEDGSRTFMAILMATPVIGDMLVQSAMERFATNMALLLKAGMPLLDSLYAMNGVFHDNAPLRDTLAGVQRRVASGDSLASGLTRATLFTPMVVNLVAVGEESGQLPKVLEHAAAYYKQRVKALVERITSMIEPAIILFMGVTVAVILTAIYLPMFNMGGAVK